MADEKPKGTSWDDICGPHTLRAVSAEVRHPFSAESNGFALDLGSLLVFVFEDPSDGYRSSAGPLLTAAGDLYSFGCNPVYIRAPVVIRRWTKGSYGQSADGIEVIDTRNGATILTLGTDNDDDYYPSFTCEWRPNLLAENEGR